MRHSHLRTSLRALTVVGVLIVVCLARHRGARLRATDGRCHPAGGRDPYDPPAQRWMSGHRGVDLAATDGQSVLAAGDGTVTFAGQVGGKTVVSIRHTPALWTTYEPVGPRFTGRRSPART